MRAFDGHVNSYTNGVFSSPRQPPYFIPDWVAARYELDREYDDGELKGSPFVQRHVCMSCASADLQDRW